MASDFMDRFRFNTEKALDVFYIQNLTKKQTETFCEYVTHWRSEAAKVRPSLEEEKMNKFFVRAPDLQYYERLMVIENNKFSDIIKGGGVNVIEIDEEWDQEGSIGLIREGDSPKTSPVTLTPVLIQTQAPFEVEVAIPFTGMVTPTPSYKSYAIS
nr:uncharacterized protein LOC117280607 [Nicotiana tomentosiformis]